MIARSSNSRLHPPRPLHLQSAHPIPIHPPVRDQEVAPGHVVRDPGPDGAGLRLRDRGHPARLRAARARPVRRLRPRLPGPDAHHQRVPGQRLGPRGRCYLGAAYAGCFWAQVAHSESRWACLSLSERALVRNIINFYFILLFTHAHATFFGI